MFGFIGYGKMGGVIVRTLLKDGSLAPEQVVIYNRTRSKLDDLKVQYPSISIADSPSAVAQESDVLFVCTLTGAIVEVMKSIEGSLKKNTHLVTITGALRMVDMQMLYDGPITKSIPSITLEGGRGITLLCHDQKVQSRQKEVLNGLFSHSSKVIEVTEDQLEVAADLTSTSPALMTKMMDKWAEMAIHLQGISKEEAKEMIFESMLGTAILLTDGGVSPKELMDRVATKGGITEQGLNVLDMELPHLYSQMFKATRNKREEVRRKVAAQFDEDLHAR